MSFGFRDPGYSNQVAVYLTFSFIKAFVFCFPVGLASHLIVEMLGWRTSKLVYLSALVPVALQVGGLAVTDSYLALSHQIYSGAIGVLWMVSFALPYYFSLERHIETSGDTSDLSSVR